MCEGNEDRDEDEDENDDDDGEERAVSVKKARRRGGAAQDAPGNPRKRAPRKVVAADANLDPDDLVGRVLHSPQAVVKEVLALYGKNANSAATFLLNVLAQFSGKTECWNEDDWQDLGVEGLAADLETASKKGGVDHFKDKGLSSKEVGPGAKAKRKLTDFFTHLAWDSDSAGLDVLALLQDACDFCILLSGSAYFNCRITAVAAATAMMTAFVDLINKNEKARDRALRQLNTATEKENKSKASDGSARIASLKATADQVHRSVTALKDKLTAMWEAIMNERFRDVVPSIRHNVIQGIAYWTAALPSYVLHDKYLKYLAWSMSDKDAGVRVAALRGMQTLYSSAENIPLLHGFTERFRHRIKELVLDVHPDVAAAALNLQVTMLEQGLLQLDGLAHATRALKHPEEKVRDAAAELLAAALEQDEEEASHDSQATARPDGGKAKGKKRPAGKQGPASGEAWHELQRLCDLFRLIAAETPSTAPQPLSHEVVACVVEHLASRVDVLTNWQALCDAIGSEVLEDLSPADATNLVTLLNCCVEHAVAQEQGDGLPAARRAKDAGSVRQEITLILMDALPDMLRTFRADPITVTEVVGLIPLMDLEMYVLKRQQAAFKALTDQVVVLFERLSEDEPLEACAWALQRCTASPQPAVCDITQTALRRCIAKCVDTFDQGAASLSTIQNADLKAGHSALTSPNKEERREAVKRLKDSDATFAIAASTSRVKHLVLAFPAQLCGDDRVWNSVSDILEACAQGRLLPSDVCSHALSCAFKLVLAEVQRLCREPAVLGRDAAQLKARIALLASKSEDLLRHSNADVQAAAALSLTDLLSVFSESAAARDVPPEVAAAFLTPSLELANALWEHCEALLDGLAEAMSQTGDAEAALAGGGDEGSGDPLRRALADAREAERAATDKAMKAVALIMRLVAFGHAGAHARMLGSAVLAHTPLLGDDLFRMVQWFMRKVRKDQPALLPGMVVDALKTIFDELVQVDNSRYGLNDFADVARLLAQPLSAYGTPASMIAAIWAGALAYFDAGPSEHHEFLTQGMVHFIEMLAPSHARTYADQLSGNADQVADADALADFLAKLEARAQKGGGAPKTAMKKKKGAATKRRITFRDDAAPASPGVAANAANALRLLPSQDRIEDNAAAPSPWRSSRRSASASDGGVGGGDSEQQVSASSRRHFSASPVTWVEVNSGSAVAEPGAGGNEPEGAAPSQQEAALRPRPSSARPKNSFEASESDGPSLGTRSAGAPANVYQMRRRAVLSQRPTASGASADEPSARRNSLAASVSRDVDDDHDGDDDGTHAAGDGTAGKLMTQRPVSQAIGTPGWDGDVHAVGIFEELPACEGGAAADEDPHEEVSLHTAHADADNDGSGDAGDSQPQAGAAAAPQDELRASEDDEPETRKRPRVRRR